MRSSTGTRRAPLREPAVPGGRRGGPEGPPAGDGWCGDGPCVTGSVATISLVSLFL